MLGPGEFITAAEESGLIVDLGFWVLSEALRAAGGWPTPGGEITRLSVNVPARQLQESDFAARALALVEESGVRPQDLVLEITESVLVSKGPVTLAALNALRELGVRIAVDDFGVGYSSLAYLQELPIDILKIDKSFVENLDLPRRRGSSGHLPPHRLPRRLASPDPGNGHGGSAAPGNASRGRPDRKREGAPRSPDRSGRRGAGAGRGGAACREERLTTPPSGG